MCVLRGLTPCRSAGCASEELCRRFDPLTFVCCNITDLIAMSDETLRLHARLKGRVVNIDVKYNRGSDLYDIKAYNRTNHGLDSKEIFNESGYYWDQLGETVERIISELSFWVKICLT